MTASSAPDRTRRVKAWWEPTHAPELVNRLRYGNWALPENAAHEKLFTPRDFRSQAGARSSARSYFKARFTSCDFSGRFDQDAAGISFTKCDFENCDFGTSTWGRVKFRECSFKRCSFSQSTWRGAEFRECHWEEIGFSGNETILHSVFISNPQMFIDAGYTNLDERVLTDRGVTRVFQLDRLQETKSTVARNIFNSHKTTGDDATFYKAFSTYSKQYGSFLQSSSLSNLRNAKGWRKIGHLPQVAISVAERRLNNAFGWITLWGSSATRPLLCLCGELVVFSSLYKLCFELSAYEAFTNAFDITSIAGYTRAVTMGVTAYFFFAAALNLVTAILFYSAFFSVAFNKISRVR